MIGIGLGLTDAAANGGAGGAAAWYPTSLSGVVGIWEPFDITSVYEAHSISGTTAEPGVRCSTTGQLAGMILDKSNMDYSAYANAGEWVDDLLTEANADFYDVFDSATGWTFSDGTVSITGGVLQFSGSGTNVNASKAATFAANTWYMVKCTITNWTSGAVEFGVGGSNTNGVPAANGVYYALQKTGASPASTFVIRAELATVTLDVADVSVVALPGNHMYARASTYRGLTEQRGTTYTIGMTAQDHYTTVNAVTIPSAFNFAIDTQPDAGSFDYRSAVMSVGNATDNPSIGHGIGSGTGTFQLAVRDDYVVEYTTGVDDTAAHHIAELTATSTTFDFYKDGTKVADGTSWTSSPLTFTDGNEINIGTEYTQSTIYDYDGDFSCAYMYDNTSGRSTDLYSYINTNTGEDY